MTDDGITDRAQDDLAGALSRRGVGRILAGLVGVFGVREVLDRPAAEARRRKRRGGNGNPGGNPPPSPPPSGDASLEPEEMAFLDLINAYRVDNGLTPLSHNAQLAAAAHAHSQDMGTRNYFDHDSPEGITPGQRIVQQGYCPGAGWGENISAGRETAQATFEGWRKSPGHNENMLDPKYDETGIGRVFSAGSEYEWYWTNTFGECN